MPALPLANMGAGAGRSASRRLSRKTHPKGCKLLERLTFLVVKPERKC